MATIGYARCSTESQSLDAQLEALKAAGAARTFSEKESGARSDRPELARALATLHPGAVLLVARLDRLARSTLDLLSILERVTKAGAGFRSINDPAIDTTTPHGRLLASILGALAEFERSLIMARTQEGIRRARARGVAFGPKPLLTPPQIAEAKRRREAGESYAEIGTILGVSKQTAMRAVQ